jgi:hypothetical protein
VARRAGIIVTSVGLAVCVLAWGTSIAMVTWYNPRAAQLRVFALWRGVLYVNNGGTYTRPGWDIGPTAHRVEWWPYDGKFWEYYPGTAQWPGANWGLKLPLWMPGAAFALGLTAVWRPWDLRARRRRLGLCARCGYDVRGLAECPECGPARSLIS